MGSWDTRLRGRGDPQTDGWVRFQLRVGKKWGEKNVVGQETKAHIKGSMRPQVLGSGSRGGVEETLQKHVNTATLIPIHSLSLIRERGVGKKKKNKPSSLPSKYHLLPFLSVWLSVRGRGKQAGGGELCHITGNTHTKREEDYSPLRLTESGYAIRLNQV